MILLIPWCLNFCSAVFDLACGNHQSVFPTCPVYGLKSGNRSRLKTHFINLPKTSWAYIQRSCTTPIPPVPTPCPSINLTYVSWLSLLDLLGEDILGPDYIRWPINWYLEVHFTSKWKAGHKWLCLWFPPLEMFLTDS